MRERIRAEPQVLIASVAEVSSCHLLPRDCGRNMFSQTVKHFVRAVKDVVDSNKRKFSAVPTARPIPHRRLDLGFRCAPPTLPPAVATASGRDKWSHPTCATYPVSHETSYILALCSKLVILLDRKPKLHCFWRICNGRSNGNSQYTDNR